jgi:predicted RNA-binding protein (virulence factor B family)
MIYPGEINRLKIARISNAGMHLVDKINNEVLLPTKWIQPEFKTGDLIEVFVYKDQYDQFIATTQEPTLLAGEFALLKVRTVTQFGAYVDWGMDTDLLVPSKEQSKKMNVGEYHVVHLSVEEGTQKLYGSTKINKFLQNDDMQLNIGDQVEIIIFEKTFLGYNAIVNEQHKGLVYHDEIFREIEIGDRMTAYVKQIREDLGLDLSLQPVGVQLLILGKDNVLAYLQQHNGFLPLTDNSAPEDVKRLLQMSKKAFKKSVGILYKNRMVSIETDGIRLTQTQTKH